MPYAKIVDVDSVKLVLEAWLKAVLSPDPPPAKQVVVEFDWQAGTKPLKPYANYRITGPTKMPITEDVLFESGMPFLEGNRVFHVEVFCYSDGEEANEMITALVESFEQPQFYNIIEAGGAQLDPLPNPPFECSVASVSEPVDLTELLDTKYERRTMLEFDLIVSAMGAIIDGTPQGAGIKRVEAQGIAKDGTGNDIGMEADADKP